METACFDLGTDFVADMDKNSRDFVAKTIPKATQNKRQSDYKRVETFLSTKDLKSEDLPRMDTKTLNAVLMQFIMDLKPKVGEFYEPSTYTGIMYSLEHKFKEIGVADWQLRSSPSFTGLQDVLKAKLSMAKSAGKGNRPHRAQPLSRQEEEKMWETGAFGIHEPDALLRTLWWGFTTGFGLRGQDEHRQLMWEDISLRIDSVGGEYLEYSERSTKTRKGMRDGRLYAPKIFCTCSDNGPERCTIETYKKYAARRPNEQAPFYLAVNQQAKKGTERDLWYMKAPMGKNKLGAMMRTGAAIAEIPGKLTNHSSRKTAVKRLLDGGVPQTYAVHYTGHKSVASLTSYAEADVETQRKMARTVASSSTFEAASVWSVEIASVSSSSPLSQMKGTFTNCTIGNVTINITK